MQGFILAYGMGITGICTVNRVRHVGGTQYVLAIILLHPHQQINNGKAGRDFRNNYLVQ